MTDACYLFRLDDANPWMDTALWGRFEALFDRYGVKPIVAIIPECADPGVRTSPEDPGFWDRARAWQAKGWTIALHGFDHVYLGTAGGLVPLNRQTEFAGQPEAVQRDKIRRGWASLKNRGLEPTVWVAPSHTFDRVTLKCLQEETSIRIVSDGLSSRTFLRFGFSWIPQQLWRPRVRPSGVWTVCLHPNTATEDLLTQIEAFLATGQNRVVSASEVVPATRAWSLVDGIFARLFLVARPLKKFWGPLKGLLGLRRR